MAVFPSWAHLAFWVLSAVALSFWSAEVEGVQCYHCSGDTSSDTNHCFNPDPINTFVQSCNKEEVCEKKVIQMTQRFKKIERGCSGNCQGREHIWTTDFHVHCCDNELCNGGVKASPIFLGLLSVGIVAVCLTRL